MTEKEQQESRDFDIISRIPYYSTCLVMSRDVRGGEGGSIGAGVSIMIGKRLFVATAAHCMKGDSVVINDRNIHFPPTNTLTVLKKYSDSALDIGFFELKIDEKATEIKEGSCSLLQLDTSDLPKGGMCHVIGYPQEGATARHIIKRGFGSKFEEKRDGLLRFPFPEKNAWFGGEHRQLSTFIDCPKGFSGGGLWAFHQPAMNTLFNPEKHIKLMGIQRGWWEHDRIIVCVPIIELMKLIYQAYPEDHEIRALLKEKCPSLK